MERKTRDAQRRIDWVEIARAEMFRLLQDVPLDQERMRNVLRAIDNRAIQRPVVEMTYSEIAWHFRGSTKTVSRAVKELVDAGLLAEPEAVDRRRRSGPGLRFETVYEFMIDWVAIQERTAARTLETAAQSAARVQRQRTRCPTPADTVSNAEGHGVHRTSIHGSGGADLRREDPVSPSTDAPPARPAEGELLDAVEVELIDRWNALPDVCRVERLGETRRKKLRARLKDREFRERWRDALDRIRDSSFCRGSKGWRAHLNWFLKPDTVTKLLEGQYDDATSAQEHSVWGEFHSGNPEKPR